MANTTTKRSPSSERDETHVRVVKEHKGAVHSLIQIDNEVWSGAKSIRVWDSRTGEWKNTLKFSKGKIFAFAQLPLSSQTQHYKTHQEGNIIYSGHSDGFLRIIHAQSRTVLESVNTDSGATECLLLVDGLLWSGHRNGSVKVWDLQGSLLHDLTLPELHRVTCMVCPDDKHVWVASSKDHCCCVVDAQTRQVLTVVYFGHKTIRAMLVVPLEKCNQDTTYTVWCGFSDGSIDIYDVCPPPSSRAPSDRTDGKEVTSNQHSNNIEETLQPAERGLHRVTAPLSKSQIAGDVTCMIYLRQSNTNQTPTRHGGQQVPTSPTVWCGCSDGYVHVIDALSGEVESVQQVDFDNAGVSAMLLVDGNLWIASEMGRIRTWSSAQLQQWRHSPSRPVESAMQRLYGSETSVDIGSLQRLLRSQSAGTEPNLTQSMAHEFDVEELSLDSIVLKRLESGERQRPDALHVLPLLSVDQEQHKAPDMCDVTPIVLPSALASNSVNLHPGCLLDTASSAGDVNHNNQTPSRNSSYGDLKSIRSVDSSSNLLLEQYKALRPSPLDSTTEEEASVTEMVDLNNEEALGVSVDDHQMCHVAVLFSAPLVQRSHENQIVSLDGGIDVHADWHVLRESLSSPGREIRVRRLVATTANFRDVITLGCTVLHYSGHGIYHKNPETGEVFTALAFEDGYGELHVMTPQMLQELFQAGSKSNNNGVQLVIVSACHSRIAAEVFVQSGVPHVVAVELSERISDSSAREFCHSFYLALVAGRSVADAFEIGKQAVAFAPSTITKANSSMESNKFVLLPEAAEHGVAIFDRLPRRPATFLASCHYQLLTESSAIPPHPDHLLGRHVDVYRILEKILASRLTLLCGPSRIGKTVTAMAVTHVIKDRCTFDRVCFGRGIFWFDVALFDLESSIGLVGPELGYMELHQKILSCLQEEEKKRLRRRSASNPNVSPSDQAHPLHVDHALIVLDGCDKLIHRYGLDALLYILNRLIVDVPYCKILVTVIEPFYNGIPHIVTHVHQLGPIGPLESARLFMRLANVVGRPITMADLSQLPNHGQQLTASSALQMLSAEPVLTLLAGHPGDIAAAAPLLKGRTLPELYELLANERR